MKPIRVLLVDDQRNVRFGLALRFKLEPDIEVVGEAEDGAAALDAVAHLQPDVVLMDYQMPVMDGLEATRTLTASGNTTPVIMLSMHDSAALKHEAAAAGVRSFICKNEPSEVLLAAIRDAAEAAVSRP